MKILFLSYCDGGGGAAKAVFNLCLSFSNNFNNKLLVIDKRSKNKKVILFQAGLFGKLLRRLRYLVSQIIFFNQNLYVMSLNVINSGIANYINKSSYDIVNFHWINCETISLSEIKKINKPIVWTLHDMWPISGIYHYSLDKKYFNTECKNIIKKKYFNFLDRITYKRKKLLFSEKKIHIISPSKWLLNEAKKTGLPFGKMEVIPNPINTEYFKKIKNVKTLKAKYKIPMNKKVLLYSSLLLNEKRKGFKIVDKIINIKELNQHIFIFFGINRQLNKNNYHKNVIFIDETFKQNEIREVYSISDVLLFPSIIDNFPNTILEAMSCGLPCVAFDCYGMKEIIEHKKNGYLAKPYSIEDFKKGINYALLNKIKLSYYANDLVRKNFSYKIINTRYYNFFNNVLS